MFISSCIGPGSGGGRPTFPRPPGPGARSGARRLQRCSPAGSPILVDYGPGFSMEEAARLVGGSHKNFRGALDATFASRRAALPEGAAMKAEQAAMEDADLATAAEAERKRKAEADAREEEAAKRAKTEAAEQKKAEVVAKAATEAQAAGARGTSPRQGSWFAS